jgi:glycyl-tRNA synthetase
MKKENGNSREVLRFAPRIAPVKSRFSAAENKPGLSRKRSRSRVASPAYEQLYDEPVIGRRYRRRDEIGTPFCICDRLRTLGEKGDN